MKNISRKIFIGSLTSLTVLVSALASAEEMVTVPTLEGGVTASIGTFYAVPSADDTAYLAAFKPRLGNTAEVNVNNAQANYNWGWEAALGYIFEDTANGIELAYRGYHANETSTVNDVTTPNREHFASVQDKLTYNFDALDLMVSQYFDLGKHMQMRVSGGLSYLYLRQKQQITGTPVTDLGLAPLPVQFVTIEETSTYNGLGPRVAMDGRYGFNEDGDDSGFGIVGGASLAYFLGDLDLTGSGFAVPTTDTEKAAETTASASQPFNNQGVLNVRANLGVDYVYFFDNEESTLGLEVGYMFDYYTDAAANFDTIQAQLVNPLLAVSSSTTDVSFSGPYVNLKGVF